MTFQFDPVHDAGTAGGLEADTAIGSHAWLLAVAAVSVAAGLAAHLLGSLLGHAVGYALDSLIPFTLVAVFRRRSLERLIVVGLPPSRQTNTFAWLILIVGFACAVLHAWAIARHLTP